MSKGLFITGTGTDVGKTYVTALLVKLLEEAGIKGAYYKAAVSGNIRENGKLIPQDAAYVKKISGLLQPLETMVPYVYEEAVSPHLASRQEGNPVKLSVVRQKYKELCREYDYITMEGSGGILCPLCWEKGRELWLEDIIRDLELPCLIVADAGLGTINATVLTIEYLRMRQIKIKGVILNHFHPDNLMEQDNCEMIEKRGRVPVISCVGEGDKTIAVSAEQMMHLYE